MEDIDLSRSGTELFSEDQGVNQEQVAGALDTGVEEVAAQPSDKELNFRAVREELSKLKEEREYWKGQAEAYKSPQRQEPVREQASPFKDLPDDEWVNGQQVKHAYQNLRQEFQDKFAAIETKAQHSDWNSLVTQNVPQLTNKNPLFAEMIQNASNPYEAAYLLAELNARGRQESAPTQPSPDAQRAIHNASKPRTLESVGGSPTLSKADYYATMSDKDFETLATKNLANI